MGETIYAALQKYGYFHPLHPLTVHLTAGLVMAIFLFALAAWLFRVPSLVQTVRHCSLLALGSVPLTILAGLMDWQHFYHGPWSTPFIAKMALAVLLFSSLLAAVIKGSRKELPIRRLLPIFGFAVLLLAGLGYFGGELVYGRKAGALSRAAHEPEGGGGLETGKPAEGVPSQEHRSGELAAEAPAGQVRKDGPAGKETEPGLPDSAHVSAGGALFQKMCGFCHYPDSTDVKIGPGLKGVFRTQAFPVSGWPASEESVKKQLKTPYGTMPPFPDLTEDEVAAIIAYLKTL